MACFELHPKSLSNGEFAAAWFDNAGFTWDDKRLRRAAALGTDWRPPRLALYRPERVATAVLFNPNALAVSEGVRDELAAFPELEFLPVEIEGRGVFFLLHVIESIELPAGSDFELAEVSGNLAQLNAFVPGFQPLHDFFRVRHPVGSAARRAESVSRAIYTSEHAARRIEAVAGSCIEARQVQPIRPA
jgi:hypothetical protein